MTEQVDSPAVIVAQLLVDLEACVSPDQSAGQDWCVFVSLLPDEATVRDNIVAVFDSPGVKNGRLMAGRTLLRMGIQIRSRSTDYNEGYMKLENIGSLIDTVKRSVVSIDDVQYIVHSLSRGTVLSMGQEEQNRSRFHFSMNAMGTIGLR